MKLVKTEDGSLTFFSEKYQEHYHSISGALEEAFEKHVKALGIKDGMKILDFCFGLGYNAIAATKGHKELEIFGLENDLTIIQKMIDLEVPDLLEPEYDNFRLLFEKMEITDENDNTIKLLIGEAWQNLGQFEDGFFERVFFDPFSPKKQPEMWSKKIFHKIYLKMKNGGKLSTYSCAKMIRENMKEVGFKVLDGPRVGRKSPATIAIKNNNTQNKK